jgi:hypothetical protein
MSSLGSAPSAASARPEKVVLRSYPKIVLLYPTFCAAVIAALGHYTTLAFRWDLFFLIVLGLNLIVLSFDFPRTTSFTFGAVIIAIVFGALWLNHLHPFLSALKELTDKLQPNANSQFYWLLVTAMLIIYVFVFISTRFDYWEVMPNEIIHHHGILGNVKRFPAPQLKLEKEITDVFEFFLLRSGRMMMHPSSERITIVLDNVPNINKRERQIQELLRVLDVHVHTGPETDGEV